MATITQCVASVVVIVAAIVAATTATTAAAFIHKNINTASDIVNYVY